jgi:hypothetical protein
MGASDGPYILAMIPHASVNGTDPKTTGKNRAAMSIPFFGAHATILKIACQELRTKLGFRPRTSELDVRPRSGDLPTQRKE